MRPWDWTGVLLGRILHEANFFAYVSESQKVQRTVLEKYVEEVLTRNQTNTVQEKLPLIYKEMIQVADSSMMNFKGRQSKLLRKLNIKNKGAEIDRKGKTISEGISGC